MAGAADVSVGAVRATAAITSDPPPLVSRRQDDQRVAKEN
jgi:hypothetical protein